MTHNTYTQKHKLKIRPCIILAYAQSWPEVMSSFVSAAVSIGLISLAWLVVAPVFGFEVARADTAADYSGYYSDPAYYNYYGYGAQGRSLDTAGRRGGLLGLVNR